MNHVCINYAVSSPSAPPQAGEEGPPGSLPEVGSSGGTQHHAEEEGRAAERWWKEALALTLRTVPGPVLRDGPRCLHFWNAWFVCDDVLTSASPVKQTLYVHVLCSALIL